MDKDVLIADDSEFMRDLLREILEERYRVVASATGGEHCRSMRFDPVDGRVTVERTDGCSRVL